MSKKISEISNSFFSYLSQNYPLMSSCDEFYFFPSINKPLNLLNSLETLEKEKIIQNINDIKALNRHLENINLKNSSLEEKIDWSLIKESISGFLREFETRKIWQKTPSLYLKIAILGIEEILYYKEFLKKDINCFLISRLRKIPQLLENLKNNTRRVNSTELRLTLKITNTASYYFKNFPLKKTYLKEISPLLRKIGEGLEETKLFLKWLKPSKSLREEFLLEKILKESYSYNKSLEDIFETALREHKLTLKEMKKLSKIKLKNTSSLSKFKEKKVNLLNLYQKEVKRLKEFLLKRDIFPLKREEEVIVKEVPRHLKPLRASAAYTLWAGIPKKTKGIFYINAEEANYQEYKFISAHETYPGHHLLDSVRRKLKNPIRSQIESPLFYEGWASFSEELIVELGYIKNPSQKLIGLRRKAWRAIRALLDVGIRTNKIKLSSIKSMLKNLGYPEKRIPVMIEHYLLMPGYQLCYTIGKLEFQRLKEKYAHYKGLKKFLEFILNQGEIPFALLEEKLKEEICPKNS
ncbi:MAG TPA: DUF885 family protein [Candidatus Omnitrophica bacterium]|nr:DUF885 family protein [Candidatus Omnitrophota bacterium]